MPIKFTEEQELMISIAREFAINEVRPMVKKIEEYEDDYLGLYRRFAELGFKGIIIPEEWGGLGQSVATQVEIARTIGRESVVLAFLVGNGPALVVLKLGTERQKEKYLNKLVTGDIGSGFGFTEATGGSDLKAIQTTAVKDGDDWILNGTKTFITRCTTQESFIILAKTKETSPGGISAFIVERDMPGFSAGSVYHNMGCRGSGTGELYMKNCRVPAENLLGTENEGLMVAFPALDISRLTVAGNALGNAEGAFDKAIEFAKQRVINGKPLYKMQVIQQYVADMHTELSACKAFIDHVAELAEAGLPYSREASMAKLYATEIGKTVTDKAVQICGGYGVVEEFGVARHYRDARLMTILEGTSEIMRTIIARSVFGK